MKNDFFKNKTFYFKPCLLVLYVIFCSLFGCKQRSDGKGVTFQYKDAELSVGDVCFIMRAIPATSEVILGDESIYDNKPYKVSLDSFQIGETEVTQELWNVVMQENPSNFKDSQDSGEVQERRPVEGVSWYDCIVFCNELTKKLMGEEECVYYSDDKCSVLYTKDDSKALNVPYQKIIKKGFRLPTEAEWAWAAMGGKTKNFAGTDDKNELKYYAWFSDDDGGDSGEKTHEVKKKKANDYNLYDMCGNVREWCWNKYTENPQDGHNPTGGEDGGLRIASGGSWHFVAEYCAIIYRGGADPAEPDSINGLRLARRP